MTGLKIYPKKICLLILKLQFFEHYSTTNELLEYLKSNYGFLVTLFCLERHSKCSAFYMIGAKNFRIPSLL